jgi:hypothetical protein
MGHDVIRIDEGIARGNGSLCGLETGVLHVGQFSGDHFP